MRTFILTFFIVFFVFSCSSKKARKAADDATTGGTSSGTEQGAILQFANEPRYLTIPKNSALSEPVLQLADGISGALFSLDAEASTCDEHPWNGFGLSSEGVLLGQPTIEGLCTLAFSVSLGEDTQHFSFVLKVTGCSSISQDLQIINTNDDGYYNGANRSAEQTENWPGFWGGVQAYAFFRFRLTNPIPQNATVASALLRLHGSNVQTDFNGTSKQMWIKGQRSDSSAPILTDELGPEGINSPSMTNNEVIYQGDVHGPWNDADWNELPDISTVLQEVVYAKTGGFQTNDYIQFWMSAKNYTSNADIGVEDFTKGGGHPSQFSFSYNTCVAVNDPPILTFAEPRHQSWAEIGQDFTIAWNDFDFEDDAKIDFYLRPAGDLTDCSSHTLIQSQVSEDNTANTLNWSVPSSITAGNFHVCAIVSDGTNAPRTVISEEFYLGYLCRWNSSASSSDITNAANWLNCNGTTPQLNDKITVVSSAFQPVIASDLTVFGIGHEGAAGGGTITINDGQKLQNTSGRIQSDIKIVGQASCTTCSFQNLKGVAITHGASLTLGAHSRTTMGSGSNFYVGSEDSPGHLVADAGAVEANWAEITKDSSDSWWGMRVRGTSSSFSSVNINGLAIRESNYTTAAIDFVDKFEIAGLDNLEIDQEGLRTANANIDFNSCDNATFSDLGWENLKLMNYLTTGVSIDAHLCSGVAITITGDSTLPGYGNHLDWDENNILSWVDGNRYTCVWTGATDNRWAEQTNWSSCNPRLGYPDGNDYVQISGTPTIVIDTNVAVASFVAGGGNPTIEFDDGTYMFFGGYDGYIEHDITVKSSDGSVCANKCGINGRRDIFIRNDATLTLDPGAMILMTSGKIRVGSTTAGHIATGAAPLTQADWPQITSTEDWDAWDGVVIEGENAGSKSSVSFNRIKIMQLANSTSLVHFKDQFAILQFDNVILSGRSWQNEMGYINIENCANGTFTDTGWTQIDFVNGTSVYNVNATSCSVAEPTWSIGSFTSGTNAGYGASAEIDPNNRISWP